MTLNAQKIIVALLSLALFAALVLFRLLPQGFTARDLRQLHQGQSRRGQADGQDIAG